MKEVGCPHAAEKDKLFADGELCHGFAVLGCNRNSGDGPVPFCNFLSVSCA
ncbi:hypothetical protein ACVMHY_002926 [Bradyrhizobium barranii subsp. barranii]